MLLLLQFIPLICGKDPAYPPSRQTVYLGVAQPRGLLVLKGAGVVNPNVRDFITAEVKLRVEVPALELLPDGSIMGGVLPATTNDVLKATLHLADVDPHVVIGPDSVGTLSFTSGSTGIPKGVKGRHYSLTHFFPWMGERFGLSEDSKFTMLSGIAHDPIQRDSKLHAKIIYLLVDIIQAKLLIEHVFSVHTSVLWRSTTCTNS